MKINPRYRRYRMTVKNTQIFKKKINNSPDKMDLKKELKNVNNKLKLYE